MEVRRHSLLLLVLLCFGLATRASNIVTVSMTEGTPGEEVTVSIGLTNTDAVSGLQVSIPLDESLTLVEGSGQQGSRCPGHSLTVGVKDGVLNVLIFSLSLSAISGNSGEVATFRLKLGNQPQTISLTPSMTKLTDGSGNTLESTATGGSVTTRCAKAQYSTMEVDFGEVPIRSTYEKTVTVTNVGNADLTVTDLVFSDVNVFSTTTAFPFTVAPGASRQVNITYAPVERGSISRTLKVECNSTSKLNTIKLKAQPFAVNELHVQPASGISDEEVTVTMTMNNMDDISGYQVEFTLPDQLEYVDGSFALSDRKQDHVSMATLNGSTLRIIVYSQSDKPLTGHDGDIGSFRVKLVGRNSTMLTPTKAVLSATINNKVENVLSEMYGGQITIRSPRINTAGTLDFGAVSVTEACEKTFAIRNNGSAPLTVSRIVFNNENLSVKESLPLTIAANSSQNITVVYSSMEQTSFSATMQIYNNDPDLRLREVTVTGSRFAPNFLDVTTADVYSEEQLAIDVSINTYDPINGLQFDLVYPGQYYSTFDDNYQLEARAEGMTVTARQIDSNTLRYFCYFLSGSGIAAGEGKIMTILLKPTSGEVPEGNYSVSIKDIVLGTGEMADKYAGTDVQSSFRVKTLLFGDVNADGKVNVADITVIANHILNLPNNTFVEAAADLNGDGKVNVADITCLANLILYGNITGEAAGAIALYQETPVISVSIPSINTQRGNTVQLPVNISNKNADFSAFQFDVALPAGVEIVDASVCASRNTSGQMLFNYAKQEDGTFRIMGANLDGRAFAGNDGSVVLLTLAANDTAESGVVEINEIVLAENGNSYELSKVTGLLTVNEPTGIDRILWKDGKVTVCMVNGVVIKTNATEADIDQLPQGIYIINGQKISIQ